MLLQNSCILQMCSITSFTRSGDSFSVGDKKDKFRGVMDVWGISVALSKLGHKNKNKNVCTA